MVLNKNLEVIEGNPKDLISVHRFEQEEMSFKTHYAKDNNQSLADAKAYFSIPPSVESEERTWSLRKKAELKIETHGKRIFLRVEGAIVKYFWSPTDSINYEESWVGRSMIATAIIIFDDHATN